MRENGEKWRPGELRETVEVAIARGNTSTSWLMNAFGLSYQDVYVIKQRMADETPDKPCPGAGRRRDVKPCGTDAGYQRHRSHGEEPCGPCRAAAAVASEARNRARRGRTAA